MSEALIKMLTTVKDTSQEYGERSFLSGRSYVIGDGANQIPMRLVQMYIKNGWGKYDRK